MLLSERVDSRDRKTLGEAGGASCERRRGVVAGAAAATCRMTALCQVCGRSQLYMQYAEGRQSQSAEAPTEGLPERLAEAGALQLSLDRTSLKNYVHV